MVGCKKVIACYIVQPFAAPVMLQDPGPFDEFIRAEQEIDPHYWEFQDKSGKEA